MRATFRLGKGWAVATLVGAVVLVNATVSVVWAAPKASSGADLSLAKTDSPDPAVVGSDLTYTITANNLGSAGATGVVVTDNLPSGVSFVSARSSQGTCTGTATVVCSLGSLSKGATATVTIVIRPGAAGTITNTASVKADQSDPKTSNNSAQASTTVNPAVTPGADLSVKKVDSLDPEEQLMLSTVNYTITVRNEGPGSVRATGVTMTDHLPKDTYSASATSSQGTCTQTPTWGLRVEKVTCDIGALDSGAYVTVEVSASFCKSGPVTNTATVASDKEDPMPSNNSSSVTSLVAGLDHANAFC